MPGTQSVLCCVGPSCGFCAGPSFASWRLGSLPKTTQGGQGQLTNVEDPLLCRVLPRVPVLPVFQLFISVFVFTEDHHHHALQRGESWNLLCVQCLSCFTPSLVLPEVCFCNVAFLALQEARQAQLYDLFCFKRGLLKKMIGK